MKKDTVLIPLMIHPKKTMHLEEQVLPQKAATDQMNILVVASGNSRELPYS